MPSTISSHFVSLTPATQMQEVVLVTPDKEEKQATEDIVSLSSNEERERKLFMGDINKFMAEIGKPLSKIPIMGYKELDLFQLFKEVTAYGGFIEVVKNVGTWSKIWKRLGNFDPSITDSSFRLKKNYERYLLDYEYKMFPEHRQQAIDMEKAMQMKKTLHGERPRSPTNDIAPLQQTRKSLKSSDGAKGKPKKPKRRTSSGLTREKAGDISSQPREPNGDKTSDVGDYSSSPSSSPTFGRKRRSSDEEFSDSDDDYEEDTTKKQKLGSYDLDTTQTNSLFTSKKELEDLESAVATLQALKYCAVF